MIDITFLESKIEELAEEVHNAWWEEKEKQGFHHPSVCSSTIQYNESKKCSKCHPDMIPYKQLEEKIKDYDRTTVKTVLRAIQELCKK